MSTPISGFTAIPNPQMLAFMPIQSYLMMFFAGAGWQIGKRKISAIPNDSFNKLSINDLLKMFTADLKETIPTLEKSLQDVTPMVGILVEQYGDFVKEAIKHLPTAVQNALGPTAFQADNLGDLKAWLEKQSILPSLPSASGHIDTSTKTTITGTSGRETTPALLDYFRRQLEKQQAAEASTIIKSALPATGIQPRERKRISTQTAKREYNMLSSQLSKEKSRLARMPKTERKAIVTRKRILFSGFGRKKPATYRKVTTYTTVVPFATIQQIAKIKSIQSRMAQEKAKYPWAF